MISLICRIGKGSVNAGGNAHLSFEFDGRDENGWQGAGKSPNQFYFHILLEKYGRSGNEIYSYENTW